MKKRVFFSIHDNDCGKNFKLRAKADLNVSMDMPLSMKVIKSFKCFFQHRTYSRLFKPIWIRCLHEVQARALSHKRHDDPEVMVNSKRTKRLYDVGMVYQTHGLRLPPYIILLKKKKQYIKEDIKINQCLSDNITRVLVSKWKKKKKRERDKKGTRLALQRSIISFNDSVLTWPKQACHLDDSVDACIWRHYAVSACKTTLYSLFLNLIVWTISRPFRSNSINVSPFILTSYPTSVAWPKLKILLLKPRI